MFAGLEEKCFMKKNKKNKKNNLSYPRSVKVGLKKKISLIQANLAKLQGISENDVVIREVILDLCNSLERLLNNLLLFRIGINPIVDYKANFFDIFGYVAFSKKIEWLMKMQIIDKTTQEICRALVETRNAYAHGKEKKRFYRKKPLTYITLVNLLYREYQKAISVLLDKQFELEAEYNILVHGKHSLGTSSRLGVGSITIEFNSLKDLQGYKDIVNEYYKASRKINDFIGFMKKYEKGFKCIKIQWEKSIKNTNKGQLNATTTKTN